VNAHNCASSCVWGLGSEDGKHPPQFPSASALWSFLGSEDGIKRRDSPAVFATSGSRRYFVFGIVCAGIEKEFIFARRSQYNLAALPCVDRRLVHTHDGSQGGDF
jgi:hypothetical protein